MSKHLADDLRARKLRQPHMRSPAITVELIAAIGLALSTLIAITAVSIGIARAQPAPIATVLFTN
jgi:hypothetical protein